MQVKRGVKVNWSQSGMPSALVSRIGQRNELAEFKSVLNEAGNHVMSPVDAESMAQDLVESGGRELVEMVRELTTALTNAEKELENANRRYERLTADLTRRGISIAEDSPVRQEPESPRREPKLILDGIEEWEEWNQRFQSLLG